MLCPYAASGGGGGGGGGVKTSTGMSAAKLDAAEEGGKRECCRYKTAATSFCPSGSTLLCLPNQLLTPPPLLLLLLTPWLLPPFCDADATVDKALSKKIMQARTAKKMSQKDLATRVGVKSDIIQSYENGKAIPNQQVIGKIEKALGCQLREKKFKKKK